MNKEYNLEELSRREEELFARFLEKNQTESKNASDTSVAIDTKISDSDDTCIESLHDILPDISELKGNDDVWKGAAKLWHIVRRKENIKKLSCLGVPAFLVVILVLNLLTPPAKMSQKENRTLAQFPKLSLSSLASGKFMADFESYISDQFVFRNHFVAAKRRYEVISGKEENHNILMCDDGYLIENTSQLTEENILPNIEAINTLAAVDRYNVTVAVVPTAYEIMKEKLPAFAYTKA